MIGRMETVAYTDEDGLPLGEPTGSALVDALLAHVVTLDDTSRTVAEWIDSEECNVGPEIGLLRASAGWPINHVLTAPTRTLARYRFAKHKRSRFNSVTWHKATKRWFVQVWHEGKCKPYGYFTNEWIAAAHANIVMRTLFGGAAKVNVM